MAARKPQIRYSWALQPCGAEDPDGFMRDGPHGLRYAWRVNWALIGGNGEIMCQSNQGHRDKTDARRSVETAATLLGGLMASVDAQIEFGDLREVGPGRKPKP
ncbi:MAG: hypothetical protein EOO54_15375 [Haliea sp.]|nr:MAG: hypothetical protein EOO54_15375 [Haliea sp.]